MIPAAPGNEPKIPVAYPGEAYGRQDEKYEK